MKDRLIKGKRIIKDLIVQFYRDYKYFTCKLAVVRLENSIFRYIPFSQQKRRKWMQKQHDEIEKYIYQKYFYIFDKYSNKEKTINKQNMGPIWTCWWQGEDNAPEIVKLCIKSIRQNTNGREVFVITEDNFRNFVEIPDYILEKLKNGDISITHMSDILRVCLLYQYGGIWIDATNYCIKKMPQDVFQFSFYTGKSPEKRTDFISKYRWTTFFIGSVKEHMLFSLLKEFFFEYTKKEKYFIDYLLFDYVIDVAYQYVKEIRKDIKEVPYNNLDRDSLIDMLNDRYVKEISHKDTFFYKLSWKMPFYEMDKERQETVYGHLLNEYREGIK